MPLCFEEAFGFEGGGAAGAGGGDGLAVDRVGDIACGVDPFDFGFHAVGDEVANIIHFQLADKGLGVGFVTDGREIS